MNPGGYKRKHLRAPIKTHFLYEDEGHVHKSQLVNISEEGVLIDSLPHYPEINIIAAIVDIPRIPLLEGANLERLRALTMESLERDIHRIRIKTLRRSEYKGQVDQVFVKNIGGQIQNVSQELRASVAKYVATFASNTSFLLSLLQNKDMDEERVEKIRLASILLGHEDHLKMSVLHQRVLQDYKSLHW